MPKRQSSTFDNDSAVIRNIESSAYDNILFIKDNILTIVPVGEDINLGASSTIKIVSDNIAKVQTVADIANLADIIRVADDLNALDANSIADVTVVAENLVKEDAVPGSSELIKVSENMPLVTEVSDNIDNLLNFVDTYFGAHVDLAALDVWLISVSRTATEGDLYFHTTLKELQVFDGTIWKSAGSTVNGTASRGIFTATEGQDTFTITGGYTAGFIDVWVNGFKYVNDSDVDVSSGTDIVFTEGLTAGSIVDYIAYGTFELANSYTKEESDVLHRSVPMKVKVTENVAKGQIAMPTGYNQGQDAVEVGLTTVQTSISVGVFKNAVTTGDFVDIVTRGIIEGLDTSAYTFGDILYSAGSGGVTNVKPAGSYQAIGYVVKNHAVNGAIMVDFTEPRDNTSGATGAGYDRVFYENDQVITGDYTITAGKNAMSAGSITIDTGVTVTIPTGSSWTIV